MKFLQFQAHRPWKVAVMLFLLITVTVTSGCRTARINWDARVGQYTYDQAVLDLGPPDKSAALADGTKVAEWLTHRGYSHGHITSFGGSYYYGGPWIHHYSESPSPDHFLRLTFGSDGILREWRNVLK